MRRVMCRIHEGWMMDVKTVQYMGYPLYSIFFT